MKPLIPPPRILLTGGLGFIGSHTVEHYLVNTNWHIVIIDSLRYAGRVERVTEMEGYDPDRVTLLWHDLRAPLHDMLVRNIGEVNYIVNMAADSHVDRSISDPVNFVQNNVAIALNMLEYARSIAGRLESFIQVSTDEVYGPAAIGYSHKEGEPFAPSNPYAASKSAQEMIAFSYWRTFGVPLVITNTMNNFGERQDVEKFVPMTIRKIQNDEPNIIHGIKINGEWHSGSRVWLHARNHADALQYILEKCLPLCYSSEEQVTHPLRFNVAGDREIANLEIVQMIGKIMGIEPKIEFVDFHSSRPGHDLRYSLDGGLLRKNGWKMPVTTEESFEKMIKWTLNNPNWIK